MMAVYFVKRDSDGAIKIGCSKNVRIRMYSLKQQCPGENLSALCIIDGDRSTEKALHKTFASCRLTGEWFLPSCDLIDFIHTQESGYSLDDFPSYDTRYVPKSVVVSVEQDEWLSQHPEINFSALVRGAISDAMVLDGMKKVE